MTVSTGHITALRKNNGALEAIQLDASLNPGNSGGPVLNSQGQVIGIVMANIEGTGLNFAIPVQPLRRLLSRTEITFTPTRISPTAQHEEQDFVIRVGTFQQPSADKSVELTLSAGAEDHRTFRATSTDGITFHVKATPVPPGLSAKILRVTVTQPSGEMVCQMKNRSLAIAGKKVLLQNIRQISLGERPITTLVDGQTLSGSVSGLESVEAEVGGTTLTLNLSTARRIQVAGTDSADSAVNYHIAVRQEGKVLGEQSGSLVMSDGVLSDRFVENARNEKFWELDLQGSGPTTAQTSQGLEITIPANASGFFAGYKSKWQLHGDFDVQVDYRLLDWPPTNGVRVGMLLGDADLQDIAVVSRVSLGARETSGEQHESYTVTFKPLESGAEDVLRAVTSDLSGRLRMVRTGGAFSDYYWDRATQQWVLLKSGGAFPDDIGVTLRVWSDDNRFAKIPVRVVFGNFLIVKGQITYP